MKAVVIREYGGPEVLRYEDCADPVVKAGEVLVRVAAAGINPIDTFERAGVTKSWNPLHFPAVLGWDMAGSVVSVGPGVSGFAVGDQVVAWAYHTYAELCSVKSELLARVPPGMSVADAAALPLVTVTGNQVIALAGGTKAGDRVLVSGALGAVGRAAVYTAKQVGAVAIAGVRREQVETAGTLGADEVMALDDAAAFDRLAPVDVVANAVRGKTAEQLLGKVKQGGVFASVTGTPGNTRDFPSVRVVTLVAKQNANTLQRMVDAVAAGKLTIPIERRLPLSAAAEGHAAVEKGGVGKMLLLA